MCRIVILLVFSFLSIALKAEIVAFEESDNKGLNKYERIGLMEKFLVTLPQEIKSLQNKLEENNKAVKELESTIKSLKDESAKQNLEKEEAIKAEAKPRGLSAQEVLEFKKLKEDFLTLKNQDIELVSEQVASFKIRLENIEKMLKIQLK